MEQVNDGFMFYETFKEGIDEVRRHDGEKAAEVLALDIIYYGVRGRRKSEKADVGLIHNALMISYQPSIDKAKEHKERAIKERAKEEWNRLNSKKRSKYSSAKNSDYQ